MNCLARFVAFLSVFFINLFYFNFQAIKLLFIHHFLFILSGIQVFLDILPICCRNFDVFKLIIVEFLL